MRGTRGALPLDPARGLHSPLDSHSREWVKGLRPWLERAWGWPATCAKARRAEGAPRLRGSRLATGAPRRGTCEAPPIRHGSCRDTFPSGEGAGLRALGRGSPTVAPLRVEVVRSDMVERGGDLLRRPTEATPAPPAMEPCGEMQLLGFVSCGNGWGSSPQTLAKEPSALWTLIRGDQAGLEARLAEGEPGLRGSRRATGAPRRGACGAPPIRHGNCRDTFPSGEGGWGARARAGLPYGRPASREACALRLG